MEFVKLMVGPIVGLVGGRVWDPIERHLGYLIFYKRNIKDMEEKYGELDPIQEDVKRRVDAAACERLEEVDNAVEAWLKKVQDADEEVRRIKDVNHKSFLHFCLHYKLGKQAADQIEAIDDLVKKGKFDQVTHSRPPPCTTGSLLANYEGYVMFDSRKSCFNEILNAFKDETVHMIGVYGMGGIGKTTLVKEAAKQAMNDGLFTEVVMVTVSQNLDVKRIQTGIAESSGLKLDEETVEVRAGKIEERLRKEGSRVLVILDDLWEMLELSKVGIPWPNNGTCRVVITTRREDVCNQMDCQKKVELRTLSDEESWLLFKSRAGNVVESPTMKEVAWDVAKQCAGLPLALVVLGTALKGKELKIWKIVLEQLKKSTIALDLPDVNEKVRESIALSYEFLENEAAKWCFLHCCLYPEDYLIGEYELMCMLVGGGFLEDNVRSLHEAQNRVHLLLDQLTASCLLHDVEGWQKSCVRMHDVVRDVGIWIGERDHGFFVRARQGLEEWPSISTDAKKLQNCQRLSLMYNEIVHLPSNPVECLKLETLILSANVNLRNIPEKFFQHMGALKVLDLSNTSISCLPESLCSLTSLRVLNLQGCHELRDISPINGLKMLEILDLTNTTGVFIVPEDTGGLLNLRLVHLSKESNTSLSSYFSNVLRGCSSLEQLFIPKYEVCLAELASLRNLTHLYIRGGVVDSNDSLSIDLGSSRSWTKLQEFLICFLPSPCRCSFFPEERGRSLHLTRTKHFSPLLKELLLKKLENLAIIHCQESEVISCKSDIPPHVFHNLRQLEVSNCLNLTSLGEEPLLQLKLMRVDNCPKMARLLLSKVWQSMHQLEQLQVVDCEAMLQLFPYPNDHKPMAMTELLPKLVELKLSKLPQLKSVLQPFQCLPALMELLITECRLSCGLAYYEMDMAADPFPKLEKLGIKECMEMNQMISSKSSPDASLQGSMCIFQNLTHLDVYDCPSLTHLFWSKQEKLENLEIRKVPMLESVLQRFQCLPNLMTLKIQECGLRCGLAYHELEMAADPFPKLETLKIDYCSEMSQMISSKSSPDAQQGMCIFQNLTHLHVAGCPRLTHLFWFKQAKLESLQLIDLPLLESVLQPFQCLPNLMMLRILGCGLRCGLAYHHEMEMAADPFPKLMKLYIEGCLEMSQMIISSSSPDAPLQGMCIFKNLTYLHVAQCPRLTHLFWFKQAKLETLELEDLPLLESVLQPFQCLPDLIELNIERCGLRCGLAYHEMEMAADPFPKLQRLYVMFCTEMRHLFPYDHNSMAMTQLFPKLEVLSLYSLPQLESVLQPFQCLPNLMALGIKRCGLRWGLAYHEMEMVADPFPKLERLYIEECWEMSQMISSKSSPDALQGMCIFQNLSELVVFRCPRLTHLFRSKQAKHMQQLTFLKIGYCDSLKAVVISNENQEEGASVSRFTSTSTTTTACMAVDDHHGSQCSFFPRLTKLYLSFLPQLESVLQPFQCLPNLMTLDIWDCGLKFGLAYHEMEMAADPFPKLETLKIEYCWEMSQMISSSSPNASLQGPTYIFQNLTHVHVDTCPRLTHLFWSKQAKHMQQLTSLKICHCDALRAVVISNKNQEEGASASTYTSATACMVVDHHGSQCSFFPRLTRLILSGLPKIVAFHQPTASPMEWPCLEEHLIEEFPTLETPVLGPQTSKRSRVIDPR